MKQKIFSAFLLVLVLSMGACTVQQAEEEVTATSTQEEETTAEKDTQPQTAAETTTADTTADSSAGAESGQITEEAALAAAKAYLGEEDPDTGYKYSYVSDGIMEDTDAGVQYYKIRVSWYLPEDDRYALCGYLLVSMDGESVSKFDW